MYEISSDSDDDCYINITKKLQKFKEKHAFNNQVNDVNSSTDDKETNSTSVKLITNQDSDVITVLDSIDAEPPNLIASSVNFTSNNSDVITVIDSNICDNSTDLISIDTEVDKVVTRSRRSKRKNSDSLWALPTSPPKGGKRGRGRGKSNQTSVPSAPPRRSKRRGRGIENGPQPHSTTIDISTPSPRRGSRNRRRGSQRTLQNSQSYITYSIGNTDEYPDASDAQGLFSNKPVITSEPTATVDLDNSLDNEELSVKVYWQHSEVFKFSIRKYQKLTQIFDFFVNKEGVSKDRLLFTYFYNNKNKILKPDDTPESIDYNIAKFIEGGIVNKVHSVTTSNTPKKRGFVIKFQIQNRKKPIELSIDKDQKLQLLMVKCAEYLEIPISKLVFEFDGETVQGNTTPKDLDMESGDCIDVKIVNK